MKLSFALLGVRGEDATCWCMKKKRGETLLEAFECRVSIIKSFQDSFSNRQTMVGCLKWVPFKGLFKLNFDGAMFFFLLSTKGENWIYSKRLSR